MQSMPVFRRALRKAVLAVDPRSADERFEQSVAGRCVTMYPDGEGTAAILAEHLPAADAQAVMNVLDALVAKIPADDPRSIDQKRADGFRRLFQDALADPDLPREQRRRPEIQVTI